MRKLYIIVIVLLIFSCQEHKKENNLIIEKLIKENSLLNKKSDSLNAILVECNLKNYWFDNDFEGKIYKNNEINNPEKYIVASLEKRKELIPLKPTLGGKMEFEKIQVLGEKWVIASYSDGHVFGRTIYSYAFTKNNKLKFEIISSSN